jgi:hypothetical protein
VGAGAQHFFLDGRLCSAYLGGVVRLWFPGECAVIKGLLAVVWVIVGALAGALVGVAVGFVAGAAVSTLADTSSPSGDDQTAILVGSMTAVGCTVIGAIAGAAGAIVWAIDRRGGPEREARFGDRPEDFR